MKINFDYKSNSDCEIIIHMYLKYGIEETVKCLDGVFSFVLYDITNDLLFAARDPIGIRPLFISNHNDTIWLASELKAIKTIHSIAQFKPGHYYDFNNNKYIKYFDDLYILNNTSYNDSKIVIRGLLTESVQKRLLSERPVACLLSGGLDSTIITALVAKNYEPYKLNTYSIGMKGSVDLTYANIAARYIKTNHKSIEIIRKRIFRCYRRDNIYDRKLRCKLQ